MSTTYYLALEGVKGDLLDAKHKGWFEVTGFDLDLENVGSSTGGGGAGKAVFSPLTLSLSSNTGLTPLLDLAANGDLLKGATLVGVNGGKAQDVVYRLDLANVLVTKVDDDSGPGLALTLDYSQIELETFTQDATGKVTPDSKFSFDLAKNAPAGSIASVQPAGTVDASPQPTDYYMVIDGFNGGSLDSKHKGWFEVTGFDIDLETIGSMHGGGGVGKANFSPLHVTVREADLADVMKSVAEGDILKGVRIEGVTSGGKAQAEVYELTLAEVVLTKVVESETGVFDLTLDYSKISLVTSGMRADGSTAENGEFAFDLAKHQEIDPFSLSLSPDASSGGGAVGSATTYYLALEGVKGDSLDAKHKGWFEVTGFDLDLENVGSSTGGGGAGKAVFSPLTLSLSSNTGLTPLLDLAANGDLLKGATLVGVNGGKAQDVVYRLDLANVLVTKVDDDSGPGLALTLDYSQIELETFTQDATGKVTPDSKFSFDLAKNAPAGSIASVQPAGTVDASPQPTDYYMVIDGFNGGSLDSKHKGWFEVTGFDIDLETIGSMHGGGGVGKANFSPLHVTVREADLADVMKSVAEGDILKGVRIEGVTSGGKAQAEVYELTLAEVVLTKVVESETGVFDLTLDYSKISLVTSGMRADGSTAENGEFAFDLAKHQEIDPFSLSLSPGGGTPSNRAPIADALSVATNEDEPAPVTLSVSDPDGDELTLAVIGGPSNGTLSGSGANLTYTPNADFFGADTFTYRASDGTAVSNIATVTISVVEVNDAPTVNADSAMLTEDSTGSVIDVLSNDREGPANEVGQTLRVIAASALHGQVLINADGTLSYAADADYNGSDAISYTIEDDGTTNGSADPSQASGVVTVTVSPVDDAADDTSTTQEDTAVAGDVKLNDTFTAAAAYVINDNAAHGNVIDNGDGTYFYTPDANFTGTDTFTYAATDVNGFVETQTVTVIVSSVNDGAPDIISNGGWLLGIVLASENETAATTVTATDPDPDAALAYSIIGGPDEDRFEIDPTTGVLTFASVPDFEEPQDWLRNNVYEVVVQVTDGELTDTQVLFVVLTNDRGVTITGSNGSDLIDATHTIGSQPLPTDEEDVIRGRNGDDRIAGLGGNDTLLGDAGNDFLEGGSGDDEIDGGGGIDTASYASAAEGVTVSLSKNNRQDTSGTGIDELSSVENLTGSAHADAFVGDNAANVLSGATGNDQLFGVGGADSLFGGNGNDRLSGGVGRDILSGDAGNDVFDFDSVNESGTTASTRDLIADFLPGTDKIDLSDIDAIAGGTDSAFRFVGQSAVVVANSVTWIENGGQTLVRIDNNGNVSADMVIALAGTGLNLTSGDFLL